MIRYIDTLKLTVERLLKISSKEVLIFLVNVIKKIINKSQEMDYLGELILGVIGLFMDVLYYRQR